MLLVLIPFHYRRHVLNCTLLTTHLFSSLGNSVLFTFSKFFIGCVLSAPALCFIITVLQLLLANDWLSYNPRGPRIPMAVRESTLKTVLCPISYVLLRKSALRLWRFVCVPLIFTVLSKLPSNSQSPLPYPNSQIADIVPSTPERRYPGIHLLSVFPTV